MMKTKEIDMFSTGKRINKLRVAKGIKVKELAEMMGVTVMSCYKWINGKSLPSIDNIVRLSGIFDTNIDNMIVTNYHGDSNNFGD